MEEWKQLDINNIPSDFFVNEDYEIRTESNESLSGWKPTCYKLKERFLLVSDLYYANYQYRIKPLESIRITRDLKEYILDKCGEPHNGKLTEWNGRKVEIID